MYNYSGGMFGCFQDCQICLLGLFCFPCLNSCNWARSRGEECTLCHLLMVVHPYWVRKNVMRKVGQNDNDCMDCLCTTFCMPCVVCQDSRALKN
ncbi:putative Cys-rich domain containing protein [Trichomonas vaginalis G3]|uniref:Uncharacterized Cys-rich domain containing protein n=1 Tax=Trichomonas vaginalis (strain ATCC PRA-98 / G3) TaxID=412133 RepID=A2E9B9_TRIV3|nr:uncharacterized protein TVAGG3_0421110 [Trichomonas vaginalis G3]EAY10804.1 putative Cys-rich domain containing protein [Trichomonas vaginalis G3]KAI5536056.1 Plac8 onzin related protein family [Trichomonas vaginalis G3]|eukprot:XP_001323027.1 hypothetical protein [Trichomonas vaginalis G3]